MIDFINNYLTQVALSYGNTNYSQNDTIAIIALLAVGIAASLLIYRIYSVDETLAEKIERKLSDKQ